MFFCKNDYKKTADDKNARTISQGTTSFSTYLLAPLPVLPMNSDLVIRPVDVNVYFNLTVLTLNSLNFRSPFVLRTTEPYIARKLLDCDDENVISTF